MVSSTRPAVGELAVVQRFLNTWEWEQDLDDLRDDVQLQRWLVANGLLDPGERLGTADPHRAIEVRKALRALLAANNGGELGSEALEALNRISRNVRLAVGFDAGGRVALVPDSAGFEQVLGRILAIIHTAMLQGTWERLKACANHTCGWIFYDRSRNRSRRWCAMEGCGNLMKVRRYRQRHRQAGRPPGSASASG